MPDHLCELQSILRKHDIDSACLVPCIQDLVSKGIVLQRFEASDPKPDRQEATQYIAAWLKRIGVPEESARPWFLSFCSDVLARVSHSSPSRVRHSTKSNIKYIYGSDVNLECSCEENRFRAPCGVACVFYQEMREKRAKREAEDAARQWDSETSATETTEAALPPPEPSLLEKHRKAFEEALALAVQWREEGERQRTIVERLNARGCMTRTGKPWTQSILSNELTRFRRERKGA